MIINYSSICGKMQIQCNFIDSLFLMHTFHQKFDVRVFPLETHRRHYKHVFAS